MLNAIQEAAREQFDRQSVRYGSTHLLADITDLRDALESVPSAQPGTPALDIATGAGHVALHLASLGYRVVASDLSESMLQQVAAGARERGLDVERRCHPAEDLPYHEQSFALVTSRVAPHHFSDQPAFIREVARVLQPGGSFVLIDGTVPEQDPEAEEWLHAVEKARDPSHHRLRSPALWKEWCREAGLEIVQAEVQEFKQPDLEWYFETAATSADHRQEVRHLIDTASPHVRETYRLGTEAGKIVWWWQRLTLVARKPLVTASKQ